jgi:hypothetical protein
MPRITNNELVNRIIAATDEDRIDWQPTAKPREFSASFGGKWTLVISQGGVDNRGQLVSTLNVRDSEGERIVGIDSEEDERIHGLHEMARRHALKIDDALADLLKEIDKPKN